MKRVELLAPAGDYETFLGAITAGADAVYFGGEKFGARAYATNFSEEEVCKAIRYAHLFGRRAYLTVNTLVKENEFSALFEYLSPFYREGLDGVIVQDMGVAAWIHRVFPKMELHISTQATITGAYGAELMKRLGAVRVVPARELSLTEIKSIKEETGLELETFIHGAVCYCYSGQCLFSSALGGRSGNRGKCAQPCRLPYNGEQYPLSLKDMCTVEHIPALIEAGIDSFKIEGRMKRAEYAAGVTAIYRKYIDRYYADPTADFSIEREDLEQLKSLYMRSDLQDGYYFKHNGKEMVTLTKPGYAGCSDALLEQVRKEYLEKKLTIPVKFKAELIPGKPVALTASVERENILLDEDFERTKMISVQVTGMEVLPAEKRPLSEDDIEKQLRKTGDTNFSFEEAKVYFGADSFLPVKAVNELRRMALEELENTLLGPFRREVQTEERNFVSVHSGESVPKREAGKRHPLHIEVHNLEQAHAALKVSGIQRLYIPSDCFEENGVGGIFGILAQCEVYRKENPGFMLYMALPHIFRKRSEEKMELAWRNLQMTQVDGALVRNLEEIEWLSQRGFQKKVVADANLYSWNKEAAKVWEQTFGVDQLTLPLELSRWELQELLHHCEIEKEPELIVYGRIPLMVTANCVQKTLSGCLLGQQESTEEHFVQLTDRYRKKLPVWTNCAHCYNMIYNTVPTSLHNQSELLEKWQALPKRLVFTVESAKEAGQITTFYRDLLVEGVEKEIPFSEYTSSYLKRGVE